VDSAIFLKYSGGNDVLLLKGKILLSLLSFKKCMFTAKNKILTKGA